MKNQKTYSPIHDGLTPQRVLSKSHIRSTAFSGPDSCSGAVPYTPCLLWVLWDPYFCWFSQNRLICEELYSVPRHYIHFKMKLCQMQGDRHMCSRLQSSVRKKGLYVCIAIL